MQIEPLTLSIPLKHDTHIIILCPNLDWCADHDTFHSSDRFHVLFYILLGELRMLDGILNAFLPFLLLIIRPHDLPVPIHETALGHSLQEHPLSGLDLLKDLLGLGILAPRQSLLGLLDPMQDLLHHRCISIQQRTGEMLAAPSGVLPCGLPFASTSPPGALVISFIFCNDFLHFLLFTFLWIRCIMYVTLTKEMPHEKTEHCHHWPRTKR